MQLKIFTSFQDQKKYEKMKKNLRFKSQGN